MTTYQPEAPFQWNRHEVGRLLRFTAAAAFAGALAFGAAEVVLTAADNVRGPEPPHLTDQTTGVEGYTAQLGVTIDDLVRDRVPESVDARPYIQDVAAQVGGTLEAGERMVLPVDQNPNR